MKFNEFWRIVLAAFLVLWGLVLMDVLTIDANILGIIAIAAGVLVLIDK
jgi:hypothetical protein